MVERAKTMLLKLKVTEGSNTGKEIVINKDKFIIGRADDCNLRPHSDAISRRHCVIIKTEKAVGVRDLKSRNGTLVNGVAITGDKRLRNGDTLEVGPLKFEVVLEAPAKVEKKAPVKKKAEAGKPGEMGGMVSAWLEEADDVAKVEQQFNETRQYRFDETSEIAIDQPGQDDDKKTAELKVDDEDKKDDEKGKLPKFEVKKEQPKDTHEAAQQVLRKLFNRN